MSDPLNGKVALITGGASGIGQATALMFARRGAKVSIADVDAEAGAATVRGIEREGGSALFIATDISRADAVAALIERTVAHYGALHCAVNNAAIQGDLKPTAECSEANWDRTIAINLKGVFLCLKHEIAQMLKQGEAGGAIVNVSSNFGLVGSSFMPAYSAAKHGVIGLMQSIALDMARLKVRANCIAPTAMTRLVEGAMRANGADDEYVAKVAASMGADKIAPLAAWLVSDDAADVSGYIMGARGEEVSFYDLPRPIARMTHEGGWTIEALAERFGPAIREHGGIGLGKMEI